jgi:hypothetical protein
MAEELGFDIQQGQEIFLSSTVSRLTLWPTQPPILLVAGVLSPDPRVKLLGHEADDLPPSSAEVKNMDYTFTPPYVFMAWCLINQAR